MEIRQAPIQVQIGSFTTIPGFMHFIEGRENDHFRAFLENTVDAIYCRNFLENTTENPLNFLRECLRALRPGGRIDVRTFDAFEAVNDFHTTDSETERVEISKQFLNRTNIFWEVRLGKTLNEAGFHRVERLPTNDLHMIAFKPGLL